MKKTLLALVILTAALGIAYQPQVGALQSPTAYTIEMDLQPVEALDGVYDCRVTVNSGDAVLAAPRLQIETGSEGKTRSSNPKTGEVVDLTVVSDSKDGAVTYTVEIRSAGGLLVTRHQARIRL